jgi:hypothetical protein
MNKVYHIKVCFENPKLNFFSSIDDMTKEEIREDLIGDTFNFSFKNEGFATCIDVVFDN